MFLPLRGWAKFFFGLSRAPPGVRGKVLCRSGGKIYYCSLYNLLGIILDLARRRIDENVLSPVALPCSACWARLYFVVLGNASISVEARWITFAYIYSYASRRCSLCLGSKFRIHALSSAYARTIKTCSPGVASLKSLVTDPFAFLFRRKNSESLSKKLPLIRIRVAGGGFSLYRTRVRLHSIYYFVCRRA